ncbi:hypothetical protein TRAPUB_7935 [Trametes pubescens]|uniref:Uncharacterized protein n=1 Tax=Trametes pubescens TaxID=154538 RepID=A0A1M2V1X7_TRAPU|nr:hypothetical protein TRAPUB_7935 [Trametes pubescens]
MNSVTIFTKERGRAPSSLPRNSCISEIAFLDVTIPPPLPLHVGQHIRAHVLTKRHARDGSLVPGYISEPAGVEGVIVGIRTMELAITEFIVKNDDYKSTIEYAYLTIQHIQGVTVNLDIWRRALRTFLLPLLPHTRHVALDHDVNITPKSYAPALDRLRGVPDGPEMLDGPERWMDEEDEET